MADAGNANEGLEIPSFDFGDLDSIDLTDDTPSDTTKPEVIDLTTEDPNEDESDDKNKGEEAPKPEDLDKVEGVLDLMNTEPPQTDDADDDQGASSDDTTDDEPTGDNDSDSDPMAMGIYKTLIDKNYIGEVEGFKGTMEEVDEIFEKMPDLVFDSLLHQMPEPMRHLLNFGYQKGQNLTQKDLANFFQDYNTLDVDTVTIDTADTQRAFLKQQLIDEGTEADDADDLIDLWEDKNKLEEKAKSKLEEVKTLKAQKAAKTVEETAAQREARKQQQKEFKNNLVNSVQETKWSKTTQQEVLNEIFTGSLNEKTKNLSKYPKALVQLANYMRYLDEKTGEINEEKFKKQAMTTSVKNVKKTIEKNFKGLTNSRSIEVKKKPNTKGGAQHGLEFAD